MKKKTVFILGAGFSFDAGIPMQGELLKNILNYDLDVFDDGLKNCREKLIEFIKNVYGLNAKEAENLDLEDIYTPIHKSITKNEYLKTYTPHKLKYIENCLNRLIAHVINCGKLNFPNPQFSYVESFVNHLVANKIKAYSTDHFSIISLNWDILLDKEFFEKIKDDKCSIDYCCHITGINGENEIMPALVAKTLKIPTIKLMKLHGSLNWVTCPKCHRLFVNKNEKEAIKGFKGTISCKHCEDVKLEATLMLPSFQKDLEQFHYQMIWNQAAIELSEATKLVFIGYSFPLADFDFRSLLTKHLNDEVEVDIVGSYNQKLSTDQKKGPTEQRFRKYFGKKLKKVYNCGAAKYIENNLESFGRKRKT